jgi:hypothetical protein
MLWCFDTCFCFSQEVFVGLFQDAKAHFIACHQHPVNQALHHLTNALAIALIPLFILHKWVWLVGCLVATQVFALGGHAIFEKNQPAAIRYPVITILASLSWSFDNWFGLRQVLQYFAQRRPGGISR